MQHKYTEIYGQLIEDYTKPLRLRSLSIESGHRHSMQHYRAAEFVEHTVRRTVEELNLQSRIRPDAHHFLVVNFHQMIVMPLMIELSDELGEKLHNAAFDFFHGSKLSEAVSEDIRTILMTAGRYARKGEISGHAVLDAVTRKYERLRTTRFEIWG